MPKPISKKKLKEANNPRATEAYEDSRVFGALAQVADSDGGRILTDANVKDIVASVDRLSTGFRTLTHVEMIAICADMASKLSTIRTLNRAKTNYDDAMAALEAELQQ